MSSDEEGGEQTPMEALLARHRKEKKELQAKLVLMKKTAKNGNKKQQKEAGEEQAKLEKEMAERHKREAEECKELAAPAPTTEHPFPKEDEKGEEEEAATFYKEKTTKGKNQKRLERKAEERKKAAEAAEIDEANALTSLRTTEISAINEGLSARGLCLVDIPPDGDCLFHAVAHQLSIGRNTTAAASAPAADLRRRAAAYIRAHADDFLPFLAAEGGGGEEMMDEAQFEEYCEKIEKEASAGGQWGGEPELRALAETLERKIEVLQPDGRVLSFGEAFAGRARPLLITYHRHAYQLGEHYNSTAAVTSQA